MLELTEEQVLWFRARRGHLAGPGADDAVAAARALIGAQSQQIAPSLWALAMRTRGRPTAAEVAARVVESPRSLVRTWGQRDTIHLYDPADWASIVAARAEWAPGGRRGILPTNPQLDEVWASLAALGRPVTREDTLELVSPEFAEALTPQAEKARMAPERLAAGRLLWALANRGDLCAGEKLGSVQAYGSREAWFPGLPWDAQRAAHEVNAELARRYLSLYGPAAPRDVAHYFGATVRSANTWLETFADERVKVACGARKGLTAMARDAADLDVDVPGDRDWPLRLLPMWDTLLMGHADKSWTTAVEAERKQVWRKAAHIPGTVLQRGRVVATWKQQLQKRSVKVTVSPLGGWRAKMKRGVEREVKVLAAHLERAEARVTVDD